MKFIAIDIKQKYADLILSHKKTVEIRKINPCDEEFYCVLVVREDGIDGFETYYKDEEHIYAYCHCVGIFKCANICQINEENIEDIAKKGCVTCQEIVEYAKCRNVYAWSIEEAKSIDVLKNIMIKPYSNSCGEIVCAINL